MFHTHLHSLAIGAINVHTDREHCSSYTPEHGWQTRFDGKALDQPGSVLIVIYGKKNEKTGDFDLFAWHIPNNRDYTGMQRYQKTISGPFQICDDGKKFANEVLLAHPSWEPVMSADDFPRNVDARLRKFSNKIENNFDSGEQAFIICNTGKF
ncbi:MAG: hypothetical protein P1P90_02145 [Patescibacteria group bacterium]|nr:hypothetical protein [Patescibacteria group bacterium]